VTSKRLHTVVLCCGMVGLLAWGWRGDAGIREDNPGGVGAADPRRGSQPFEEGSAGRTTADVLREAGLKSGSTERRTGGEETAWPDVDRRLFLAAGGGSLAELVGCIRDGGDVNHVDAAGGLTPVMTVRTEAQAAVLLAAGADVNARDGAGETPLHHALFADEAEGVVKLLLACGAEVDAVSRGRQRETPLLAARQLFFEGRDPAVAARVVRLLAHAGADLDARDGAGYTVLITAAVNNKPELARLMLALGADASVAGAGDRTALEWAQHLGNNKVAEVLIRATLKK